jgi:beta-galactosidase
VRGVWKILAYGGNGYNFYMLHGGTNFETWNDDEVSASYDYAAAIGQAGDLRPIYYAFKQAALFARSFPEILENSENATPEYADAATGAGLRVTARKSPAGTILFLDDNTNAPIETQLKTAGGPLYPARPMTVMPHEIRPVVQNFPINQDITLESCSARILGLVRHGKTMTLVIYGTPGKGTGVDRVDTDVRPEPSADLSFTVPTAGLSLPRSAYMPQPSVRAEASATAGRSRVHITMALPQPTDSRPVISTSFTTGNREIRVVSMPYELAQRTWFIDQKGSTYIVCGPEYVAELTSDNSKLSLSVETTAQRGYSKPVFARQYETMIFTPEGTEEPQKFLNSTDTGQLARPAGIENDPYEEAFTPPALKEWETRSGDAQAAPDYFAGKWLFGLNPPQMGEDGDTSPFAWYRTTIRAAKAGDYSLGFSDAGDWITVFVNGKRAGSSSIKQRFDKPVPRTIAVPLKAGENTIAVFAAHYGRNKLFNHLGPIDMIAAKGLSGPVYYSKNTGGSVPVMRWRWKPASAADAKLDHAPSHTDTSSPGWSDARPGEDVFNKRRGFAWYHALLPATPGPHRRMHFDGVDDNATVFLNGKLLETHRGWSEPFDVKLDAAWRDSGPNELLVLVENQDNTGGILGEPALEYNSGLDGAPVQGWREQGGLDSPNAARGWKPLKETRGPGVPVFYRTEFTLAPPKSSAPHAILRYATLGLSRGTVWLNGHNLGRYPEKTRAPGLYLPACWLKQGANSLVVFDEEGATPVQSHIQVEPEACRLEYELRIARFARP